MLVREALDLLQESHPDRAMFLDSLSVALRIRFTMSGEHCDLEEAISFCRKTLVLRPDQPMTLRGLAFSLWQRFKEWVNPTTWRKQLYCIEKHSSCCYMNPILSDLHSSKTLLSLYEHNLSIRVDTKTWKSQYCCTDKHWSCNQDTIPRDLQPAMTSLSAYEYNSSRQVNARISRRQFCWIERRSICCRNPILSERCSPVTWQYP